MADEKKKPQIEYPCYWDYKVIGRDSALIPQNIEIILDNFDYSQRFSNQSKSGKYSSFSISVWVENERERDHLFNMFQKIPTVKMVL